MFIHEDSNLLYETEIPSLRLNVWLHYHKEEGLFVKLTCRGIDFFEEIPLYDPKDNYFTGKYIGIELLKPRTEQAIKNFIGVSVDLPDFIPTIMFQLFNALRVSRVRI